VVRTTPEQKLALVGGGLGAVGMGMVTAVGIAVAEKVATMSKWQKVALILGFAGIGGCLSAAIAYSAYGVVRALPAR
jgi:hypothetical protein